jgi:anti-sigma factor RsiW
MNVSRDVIFDLLPTYFSGEASEDTRRLVESFMAADPEFGRMARRFHEASRKPPAAPSPPDAERDAFERARKLVDRRNEAFGGGVGFTLGALFALAAGLFGGDAGPGGFVIAGVFGMVAAMSWASWYRTGRPASSGSRPPSA